MTPDCQIIHGDCRTELVKLPKKSVHCTICSPPYWSLRRYEGVEPSVWGGGHGYTCLNHTWDDPSQCNPCQACGAWFGLLGLEPTIDQFVQNIVECFQAVKRVLRDDGTLWVVVGDRIVDGQFAGVTWKLAEAMKVDGWLLRCPIVWFKTDANMDSASNRPRIRHEYILAFAKSKNHYFDQDAVEHMWRGSVWPIATSNVKDQHFAPFPRQLVEKCVRLGSSERGCCPECGSPWLRNVSSVRAATRPSEVSKYDDAEGVRNVRYDRRRHVRTDVKTLGWRAGCECETLACLKCCTVLEYGHGKDELGQLSRDVLAVQQELSRVATDNEMVQPCLSGSVGSQESANNEGVLQNGQRLHSGVSPRASTGGDKRDDNAAPSGHGSPPRETSKPGRNRASYKRQTGRQSNREPVADEKDTARSSTEGAETCMCCGSQLVTVPHNPVPATVLDPFVGSGTAGIVATQQGRSFIGIDASAEYCDMARRRIANPEPEPEPVDVEGQMTMFEAMPA